MANSFYAQAGNPTMTQTPVGGWKAPTQQQPQPSMSNFSAPPTPQLQPSVSGTPQTPTPNPATQMGAQAPAPAMPAVQTQNNQASPQGFIMTNGNATQSQGINPNASQAPQQPYLAFNPDKYGNATQAADYYNQTVGPGGKQIDTSKMPQNDVQELEQSLNEREQEQTALDKQINFQKSQAQQQSASNASGVQTQLAQGREGPTSEGNTMATTSIIGNMGSVTNNLMDQLNETIRKQAYLTQQGDIQGAQALGDHIKGQQEQLMQTQMMFQKQSTDMVSQLASSGALTGLTPDQITQVAQHYGVPPELLQGAARVANSTFSKDQLSQQSTTLDLFNKAATSGVQMTPEFLQTTAQNLGVPPEKLSGLVSQYNQQAATISGNKTLDSQTKQTQLAQLKQNLSDQVNGLTTTAGKNIQALQYLYKTGASQDVIGAFKQSAGITDMNDPLTQAKLALTQAQTAVQNASVSGQPVTVDQKIALGKAIEDAINNGVDPTQLGLPGISSQADFNNSGFGSAYVPTNSLVGIQGQFQNGKLQISCPPSASNLQCGAGVNRFWGLSSGSSGGMPDSYAGKQALVDKNGIKSSDITDPSSQIKPGMAFVMPENGTYAANGHTGIVTQNLGNGSFSYTAWDDDGKGNMGSGTMTTKQVYGFANPPQSNVQTQNINGQPSGMISMSQINNMSTPDLISGIRNGSIDLNKMPTGVFTKVSKTLGAQTIQRLQSEQMAPKVSSMDSDIGTGQTLSDYTQNTQSNISNRPYLDPTTISDTSERALAEKAARQMGVPIVASSQDRQALTDLNGAYSNLQSMKQALQGLQNIPKDALQRAIAMPADQLAVAAQSDPSLAAFQTYKDLTGQFNVALTGVKRLNPAEMSSISSTLPTYTDTQDTINKKFATIEQVFKNNEGAILGKGKPQTSSSTQGNGVNNLASGILGLFGSGNNPSPAQNSINPNNKASSLLTKYGVTPHATGTADALLSKYGLNS